jgi:hypothetical protein
LFYDAHLEPKRIFVSRRKECKTLNKLGGKPSAQWSGNGVHIHQPLQAMILEQESKFAQFDQPSHTFLKFAAHQYYLAYLF